MKKASIYLFLTLFLLLCFSPSILFSMDNGEDFSENGIISQLKQKIMAVSSKINEDPPKYLPNVAAAYVQFYFGGATNSLVEAVPVLFLSGWQASKSYTNSNSPWYYHIDGSTLKSSAGGYSIRYISDYTEGSNGWEHVEYFKDILSSKREITENLETTKTFPQDYFHSEQAALFELESFVPNTLASLIKQKNESEYPDEEIDVSIKATILSKNPICYKGACDLSAKNVAAHLQERLKGTSGLKPTPMSAFMTKINPEKKTIKLKSLQLTIGLKKI